MGGDYSCIACPPNSYSPNTSSAVCDCNPGYTGSGSLNCTACEAGKYKDTQGSSSCIACPAGKFSGAGATFCRLCVSGTYSGATGVSVCTNCVEGKYFRSPGQTSNVCISCEAGKYSDAGAAECNLCVPGTEIQPITGLTRVNVINMCPPLPNGFWNNCAMSSYSIIRNPGVWTIYSTKQSEAGKLPPEVRGDFWSYWVAYAVDNTNKYSTITATWNCWDREAAQWNSYPKMRFSTNTCVGCASGKYKEMPGNYSCIACPPNSYSPNNSSAVCDCNPGYTGSGSLNCTACETGKYLPHACMRASVRYRGPRSDRLPHDPHLSLLVSLHTHLSLLVSLHTCTAGDESICGEIQESPSFWYSTAHGTFFLLFSLK
jgi:hypothetical protein